MLSYGLSLNVISAIRLNVYGSEFQDPNTLEPKLLNYAIIVEGLSQLEENTIHVTAGDHTLPGPFFEAAADVESLGAPGLGDIALYNAMGLDANGMGNHEFDAGLDSFAVMLNAAEYPFLAVNLDFSEATVSEGTPAIEIGEDGLSVEELAGKVTRSAYIEIGGERIGLIGRAPADFFNVIEDPDNTMPDLDFVGGRNTEDNQPLMSAVDMVLEQVDLLEAQGINKIVLLDHAQDFTSDPLAASSLRGIDVIVAAGSTGFMARPEADGPFNLLRAGDSPEAAYPTLRLDRDGNFVAVVNSDQLYTYVGNLIVSFRRARDSPAATGHARTSRKT
jgi:2',3'-cyclic-nucleotide 2'-phosphodiesterase (5'-nucleotidase family)